MTRSEIQKLARVKHDSPSEKTFFLGCINRKGLFDISDSKLCSWYIKFVDISDKDIIEYITDYDHLNLYYEKLSGGRIGKCEKCEKLFKQNKNGTIRFCWRHREYSRIEFINSVCVDCGKVFVVKSKSRRKVRCDSCQKLYRRKYNAEMQKNIENNVCVQFN